MAAAMLLCLGVSDMADAVYADLFGSDILLHYDASDATSLFTDTACTTAASDGNEVKGFTPQADADLAINLTGTNGPAYAANYSSTGYPALVFDGSNDALLNSSTGMATGQRAFVLIAETWIAGSGTGWNRGNGGDWQRGFFSTTSCGMQDSVVGLISFATPAGRRVTSHVAGANQSQTDCLGVCGGTRSNQTPAGLSGAFTLGALNTGALSQFGNFALHEVMVIGEDCEWGQVLRAAKIMRDKWGITDPNAMPQAPGGGGASFPLIGGGGLIY